MFEFVRNVRSVSRVLSVYESVSRVLSVPRVCLEISKLSGVPEPDLEFLNVFVNVYLAFPSEFLEPVNMETDLEMTMEEAKGTPFVKHLAHKAAIQTLRKKPSGALKRPAAAQDAPLQMEEGPAGAPKQPAAAEQLEDAPAQMEEGPAGALKRPAAAEQLEDAPAQMEEGPAGVLKRPAAAEQLGDAPAQRRNRQIDEDEVEEVRPEWVDSRCVALWHVVIPAQIHCVLNANQCDQRGPPRTDEHPFVKRHCERNSIFFSSRPGRRATRPQLFKCPQSSLDCQASSLCLSVCSCGSWDGQSRQFNGSRATYLPNDHLVSADKKKQQNKIQPCPAISFGLSCFFSCPCIFTYLALEFHPCSDHSGSRGAPETALARFRALGAAAHHPAISALLLKRHEVRPPVRAGSPPSLLELAGSFRICLELLGLYFLSGIPESVYRDFRKETQPVLTRFLNQFLSFLLSLSPKPPANYPLDY